MTIESIVIGADLAKALADAHAEIHNPKTDSENSYFSSRYTSLGACRNAAVPVLAKHGITLMQDLTTTKIADLDGQMMWATECRTMLVHVSGQALLFGPLTLPAKEGTPQALGSSATYNRRYSLNGVASIAASEDDDDGNAATHADTSTPTAHQDAIRAQPCANVPPKPQEGGLPLRPTGQFGYGKKYVHMPWNVMDLSSLEWFLEQANTPPLIREKCKAELAWRTHDRQKADALKAAQNETDSQAPDDSDVPF